MTLPMSSLYIRHRMNSHSPMANFRGCKQLTPLVARAGSPFLDRLAVNVPNTASSTDVVIEDLYASWRRLGVNFTGRSTAEPVDVERLILHTAQVAGADERLTVCAVSWLAVYHSLVDGRRLSELAREAHGKTRAYLGAILTLAIEAPDGAGRAPEFNTALSHCRPLRRPRAFYDVFERLPTYRDRVRALAPPLYRRWGLWHDDMTLKRVSLHDLNWLLKVPELRARALCGPSIEASCVAYTKERVTNARSLSRQLDVSYAAAHAAVERLVGRGLLVRQRNGIRQDLRLSPFAAAALAS